MSRFAGKKAVVIGGTHGMGLAVAKALCDGGLGSGVETTAAD